MGKRILRIAYAVLLLIVTTFSWILTGDAVKISKLKVDYSDGTGGNLVITNVNVEATILVEVDGKYKPLAEMGNDFVLGGNNMVPGSAVAFKIRLKNTTNYLIQTGLTMYMDVPTDAADKALLEGEVDANGNKTKGLFSYLFIEIKPGEGYYGTTLDPIYIRFDDSELVTIDEVEKYALGLYGVESMLNIPRVGDNSDGVELDCNIYFDEEADYTYQDISFIIDYFRMEQ